MRDHKTELANKFATHHLDGTISSSRFLHLVVISYLRSGRDESALDLLLMARNLYPNEEVFIYELVLFHAERGRCGAALAAWQVYKDLFGEVLAAHKQSRVYHYYPEKWVSQAGMIASVESQKAAHHKATSHNIKAHKGSYLSQLCTAITGLCPADHEFAITQAPRPKTALVMGLHYSTKRLLNDRNEMRIQYRQANHLTTPHQQDAQLSLSLRRYQNRKIGHSVSLGVHHRSLPSYKGGDRRRDEGATIELARQTKLSATAVQQVKATFITGRDRRAGYKGYGFGLSYQWHIQKDVNLSAYLHAHRHKPAQNDVLGPYLRDGYQLGSYFRLHPDLALEISFSQAESRYEKTLPYLAAPHQVTNREKRIKVIYTGDIFGQFRPYFSMTNYKSKSENDLQTGKSNLFNIGLTASF